MQFTSKFLCFFMFNHISGTLDGFSFDSDDDADKMPKTVTNQTDQNEGDGEQSNTKTKTKAEKTSVCFLTFLSSLCISLNDKIVY